MTPGTEQNVTDDREVIQSNVRRVAPIAAIVMIFIAALIWTFGSPYSNEDRAPLPECAPPRGEMISI